MRTYLLSLLNVVCEMGPYLLLGFLIAGLLHVFVPQGFYSKYSFPAPTSKWHLAMPRSSLA